MQDNEKFFTERDGKSTVCLSYNDGVYPFNRVFLTVVDFSVSDNSYVVTSRDIDKLFEDSAKKDEEIKQLKARLTRHF